MKCLLALGLALASLTAHAAGGVQRYVDAKGVVHYSNVGTRPAGTVAMASKPAASKASIFKFRDSKGVTHYTDKRPRHVSNFVVISVYCPACDPRSPIDWDRTRLNTTAYAAEISAAASANGVDPALVRALIHAESAFNPQALSRKGAQGLMQLMPATGAMYGVSNAFDAAQNINAGVQHLAMLMKKFNGDVKLVAAAYNAGEGAVKKYGGVPPYDETRVYVQRVNTLLQRYRAGT